MIAPTEPLSLRNGFVCVVRCNHLTSYALSGLLLLDGKRGAVMPEPGLLLQPRQS